MSNGRVVTHSEPWPFRAQLSREHDGDSFWMLCDTGFSQRYEPELRLWGVRAPEIRPMQPGGAETTAYVNGWFVGHMNRARRWPFHVEIVMETTFEPDMDMTFTRYLATVWPFDQRGSYDSINYSVNTFLSGHPEWGGGA